MSSTITTGTCSKSGWDGTCCLSSIWNEKRNDSNRGSLVPGWSEAWQETIALCGSWLFHLSQKETLFGPNLKGLPHDYYAYIGQIAGKRCEVMAVVVCRYRPWNWFLWCLIRFIYILESLVLLLKTRTSWPVINDKFSEIDTDNDVGKKRQKPGVLNEQVLQSRLSKVFNLSYLLQFQFWCHLNNFCHIPLLQKNAAVNKRGSQIAALDKLNSTHFFKITSKTP